MMKLGNEIISKGIKKRNTKECAPRVTLLSAVQNISPSPHHPSLSSSRLELILSEPSSRNIEWRGVRPYFVSPTQPTYRPQRFHYNIRDLASVMGDIILWRAFVE